MIGNILLGYFSVDAILITVHIKGHLGKWKGDILSVYQVTSLHPRTSHIINSNSDRIVHTKLIRHKESNSAYDCLSTSL